MRLLGQGGMGVVYEAEEIETGRRVALKVLSAERRRDVDRERFLREGRLAASLNHPHCVFVFGAWEIDGELVIAMELMRETLADRLKHTGRLPFAVAVDAILQVNAGLEAAAAAGILHRDVKPSNCFVDEQRRVKIGDFGISISALTTPERGLATGHRIVGTPGYASPEQLRGDGVDVRTDIYGVGATLYELVTGHAPFDKPDLMSLLMAVANENAPAPHRLDRTIPRGLSQIIVRCLAKKPERRFTSHTALASALQRYSSSRPREASPGRRIVATLDRPRAPVVDVLLACSRSAAFHRRSTQFVNSRSSPSADRSGARCTLRCRKACGEPPSARPAPGSASRLLTVVRPALDEWCVEASCSCCLST